MRMRMRTGKGMIKMTEDRYKEGRDDDDDEDEDDDKKRQG
jgi:hypothetical protein